LTFEYFLDTVKGNQLAIYLDHKR